MEQLTNFSDNSFMDSNEHRRLSIRYYLIQNHINSISEKKFEASGLWTLSEPEAANRWYRNIEDSESSK